MASVITNKTTSFLIFLSILIGTQCYFVENKTEVNASVGQNISLPCVMSKENPKISQLQWHKEGEQGEQSLVVFNPAYPPLYHVNVTLELVKINSTKLQGSILHLQEVTVKDSGDYVCDISAFPEGSIKSVTKVRVTEPNVSVEVMPADKTVVEGDTVNITCVSNPAPDKYILSSGGHIISLSYPIMESKDGKFTIQNINRSNSDLICQPSWFSPNQHFQTLKATVRLTVDFLDNIECNFNSQVPVETGTNLMIACQAKSSNSLHFIWMKDNMTVSTNASLNLWSVTPNQSGTYTLIVRAQNHRLHRQKDFTVTVMNNTPTAHLSSTMTMETTTQISSTTMTTPEPVTMLTTQSHGTSSTTDTTSTEKDMYISTSAPSTGTVTMVHVKVTTPHTKATSSATTHTQTSGEVRTVSEFFDISSPEVTTKEFNYVHPDTSAIILTSASSSKGTVRISNIITTKLTGQGINTAKSHVVFGIIPFLLVLLLIAFLFRQYHIQRRLDMPPPFKPPPPPVKYTSAKYNIPITNILV